MTTGATVDAVVVLVSVDAAVVLVPVVAAAAAVLLSVVAAAVVFPKGFIHTEIKDSKLISAADRERLAPEIRQAALCWGVGVVDVEEIDRINILQASLLAMVKALRAMAPQRR